MGYRNVLNTIHFYVAEKIEKFTGAEAIAACQIIKLLSTKSQNIVDNLNNSLYTVKRLEQLKNFHFISGSGFYYSI